MEKTIKITGDNIQISDGYHTFDELYDHRFALYIALCRAVRREQSVWKSKLHSDGTMYPGWFILGIGDQPGQQITYHLPMSWWDRADFHEDTIALPWDGHTSDDVVTRLLELF
jgi:hypothetical protein